MTIERAIEILDPEHREHYESIEPVNEACRIGIAAIKRVQKLEVENAELRKRLDKSIELPCKFGDFVYIVYNYPPEMREVQCHAFVADEDVVLVRDGLDSEWEIGVDNDCILVTLDRA